MGELPQHWGQRPVMCQVSSFDPALLIKAPSSPCSEAYLQALGWTVIPLPYRDWIGARGREGAYLLELLGRHGVLQLIQKDVARQQQSGQ